MDVMKMLNQLRDERTRVDEAITTLTRLAQGSSPRRGRPPNWMKSTTEAPMQLAVVPRKRKPFSAATRKRMAQAQKARWAKAS